MSAPLPQAQQRVFDKLGREFDAREYKKALRSADSILAVVPDHADTIAMKGLTLHNLDRKEEGLNTIKEAIALNAKSTIAWHSLGMCHRSEKNYTEALTAFKCAHQSDPSNVNVLRDISSICVQLRDWEHFVETRQKMVTLKASVRANWIALSCGHRMLGHTELAAAVMDVMTNIMDAGDNNVEKSEVHLYRVELELARNAPARALELLKKHDAEIVDEAEKTLLGAKAYTLLGQKVEAEKRYMELISKGIAEADCIAAIAHLRKIPLDTYRCPKRDEEKYLELLLQVLEANPKCDYAKRRALDYVPIDQFKERLRDYAARFITKMIPSLFSVLKSLYQDTARATEIGEVFLRWEEEVKAKDFSSFGGAGNPCYILWIWMYLASHYCRLREFDRALDYINLAIDHTPTVELLYLMKAKIQERSQRLDEAAMSAEKARQLDLQDKYLNGKAAKYFLRANRIEEAEERMQLFYKTSAVPGDTYLTALESQCAWYEREVGDAFYRKGDYMSALANYLMYEEHHMRNHIELLDFHNYVFRRCTMRAWFDVLARDDDLEGNKFFLKLCPRIVRTYMKVCGEGEEAVRAKHKPRPELEQCDDADENTRLMQLRKEFYLDNVDISNPLKKAERYLPPYLVHNAASTEAHLLALEFYSVTQKPLLVARELMVLAKLKEPRTGEHIAAFERTYLSETAPQMDPRMKAVVEEALATARARLKEH
ncbi:putative N-acetyltransferase subunit Nat1 [Trypanosoma grayi]|uniref:putative N-acetyltransferase subunit Nat1 n=1 Tax=Trypanosoma grayi TaxID=71804 RepID=UPI0004F4B21A|nr:putative N-acetyltransferase subunit Nat1 [Trypanosoma grayi]KEG08467.1 putative N-acetyltransferase subunit Nat1 [Trypanosoma grayi]